MVYLYTFVSIRVGQGILILTFTEGGHVVF